MTQKQIDLTEVIGLKLYEKSDYVCDADLTRRDCDEIASFLMEQISQLSSPLPEITEEEIKTWARYNSIVECDGEVCIDEINAFNKILGAKWILSRLSERKEQKTIEEHVPTDEEIKAIEFIKEWPYEDDFVSHAYSQTMYGGEPSDNSRECAIYWRKEYDKVIAYISKLTGTKTEEQQKEPEDRFSKFKGTSIFPPREQKGALLDEEIK